MSRTPDPRDAAFFRLGETYTTAVAYSNYGDMVGPESLRRWVEVYKAPNLPAAVAAYRQDRALLARTLKATAHVIGAECQLNMQDILRGIELRYFGDKGEPRSPEILGLSRAIAAHLAASAIPPRPYAYAHEDVALIEGAGLSLPPDPPVDFPATVSARGIFSAPDRFESFLTESVFRPYVPDGDPLLVDLDRPDGPQHVFCATELKTASHFYYTGQFIHSHRFGSSHPGWTRLAEAVAASAANSRHGPSLSSVGTSPPYAEGEIVPTDQAEAVGRSLESWSRFAAPYSR